MSGINSAVEKLLKLGAAVVLGGPVDKGISRNYIFPLVSETATVKLTDPIAFRINLPEADADMLVHYGTRKVFCSLVTLDEDGIPVKAAKTFYASV